LAGPRAAGDPVKAAIHRAARQAGLSYWRAFDIWYGKARRIEHFEEMQIEQALRKRRKVVAHNELSELKARIARLENLLLESDEEFFCEDVAALRGTAEQMG
jgi:hypothetical protein